MFQRNKIAIAVASAVGVGAVGVSIPAFAQDADTTALEEVIVTGSRIKRADIDTASPVSVISREDLISTGLTDVGDLIQSMPSMSGSPIGTTTNNGGNGSVQVDLRGLGVNRTLTLVNGQRVVDGGDFQTIAASMIERVEILKDGASAVYGADAVAGVVNIITRRDFEGIELTAQTADWFDTDGAGQDTIGIIAGKQFDGGNFTFGAEFIDQTEAYQADVPWEFMTDSFYIYPEGCENSLTEPYPTGCYRLGSSRIPESRLPFFSQGTFLIGQTAAAPYQAGLMVPHDGRNYNYAPVNYMQTPYERTNVFAEGHFEIADNVRFNAEFRGNFRESSQELAPLPYTGGDPFYNGVYQGTAYQGVSEDNYYLRQAVDRYNAANGTSLVYEPVIQPRRRMIETKRRFEQDITQFQFIAGLEGEFNDINWDVFVNQGYRTRNDIDFGQFSGVRLGNALGPSADLDGNGQPECYSDINDASTLIANCVPLNLFGGGTVERATGNITSSSLTQDMIDYVAIDLVDQYKTKNSIFGGSFSGQAFDLPGGVFSYAAGYQYFDQTYTYAPDTAKVLGAATGNVGAGTDGSITNTAVFVEFDAPLWRNGAQHFTLTGGYRYDDYDVFDGDDTWQLGAEFRVSEALKLRATAGTVFRAPTVSDLFGGIIDSFPTYSDPCVPTGGSGIAPGCAQVGVQTDNQVHASVGGNRLLTPETGDTFTAGLVFTPELSNGDMTLTLDYWELDLENGISSLGVQNILNDCYIRLNQGACALITRDGAYQVIDIQDASLNVATQGAKGVDLEIRYNFSTNIGDWEAAFLMAHLLERTKTAFTGDPEQDLSGRYTDPTAEDGGAYAENKFNASLKWNRDNLTIGWLMEYIDGLDADTFCNCGAGNRPDGTYIQDIDAAMFHDLVVNYKVGDTGLTVAGGITNVFEEEPPFIETGFNAGTDPSTYRLFGRGYYVRLGWKF